MTEKHLLPSELNKYAFCPMYYQFDANGNNIHKKALVNQNTRRLFTWALYQLSSGVKNIQSPLLEEKANLLFGKELGQTDSAIIAKLVYRSIQKLLTKVQSCDTVVSSIDVPITVAGSSVLCTIDGIITEAARAKTWFVFLDTSEPLFMNDQILHLPNIVIPIMKLQELFELPEKQIKIAIIRIATGDLLFPKFRYYNRDVWNTMESLVTAINSKLIYRKLSFSCKGCSYKTLCLNRSCDDNSINEKVQ